MNDGFLILLCILFLVVVGGNMVFQLLGELGFWRHLSEYKGGVDRSDCDSAHSRSLRESPPHSMFDQDYWQDKEILDRARRHDV